MDFITYLQEEFDRHIANVWGVGIPDIVKSVIKQTDEQSDEITFLGYLNLGPDFTRAGYDW